MLSNVMVVSTLLEIYAKYEIVEKTNKLFDKMHDANPHFFMHSCNFDAIYDTSYVMYNVNYFTLII